MPTMRLSISSSVMRSTSRNGSDGEDPLNGRVVEGQLQIHGVNAPGFRGRLRSIIRLRSPSLDVHRPSCTHPLPILRQTGGLDGRATPRPSDQQLLTTLFDLGRQVTSVLDLDELLQRIRSSSAG